MKSNAGGRAAVLTAGSGSPEQVIPEQAMPPGTPAPGEIGSYLAGDGRRLRFQVVATEQPRRHLLYLHGMESHGGWFLPAAHALRTEGCTTWLLDRRGSGLNRDLDLGHAPSAQLLLDDVHRMRAVIAAKTPDVPIHLVGLSWGGKLATAVALDGSAGLQSLTLITPGLCALVDLPLLQKVALLLDLPFGGRKQFKVPIQPEAFTSEPHLLAYIRQDPWRLTHVTARMLWASRSLDPLIRRRIAGLRLPVLLCLAENDAIIDNAAVLRLLSRLPPGQPTVRRFASAQHAIQLEQTSTLVGELASFFRRVEKQPC